MSASAGQAARSRAGAQQRREAVGPFLEWLGSDVQLAEPGESNQIPVGDRVIDLSPWEWGVLARGLAQRAKASEDQRPEIDGWSGRFAEGVAFQARYLTHVSRLQEGPAPAPAELDDFRHDLLTDAALGLALQEELQRDVDNLLACVETDAAKKLSAFRHKIGQSLARLKEVVGDEGFQRAATLAAAMTALAPKQSRLPESDSDDAPRRYRGRKSRRAGRKRPDSRGRVRKLALLLAACAVAAAVVHLSIRSVPGPPSLPPATFKDLDGVHGVAVRPPSLFVTVNTVRWEAMTPAERTALVEQVGEIAERSGYTGVQFRTPQGATVAQWLASGGARLLAERPDGGKS